MYGEVRNLYLVQREKRLYSILARDEKQAFDLKGEILDTVFLGISGERVEPRWWDWDNLERRMR